MGKPDMPLHAVAVDLVVLTVRHDELQALLVRRGIPPFKDRLALPGGFVLPEEDLAVAASRELREETGIRDLDAHLEQLATYGAPKRDPRRRVITVAYLALAADLGDPVAGSDASHAEWHSVDDLVTHPRTLAFDHHRILGDGLERARAKLEYSNLAAAFCAETFTVAELRRVYEAVWGVALDPRNFHRKVTNTPGFLVATGHTTKSDGGRPAQLYRTGDATMLNPPITRA